MHEHISGIVPPMTTPFRADDTIDEKALRAEARYLVETARVHGLAVTGSTGEGHALTTDEVRRVTAIVTEEVRGRVPVIAGVITDSTAPAVARGLAVRDLGVAALQVTPVHYLFRPDDDAMVRHFDTLATRTGVPVIIHNVVPWTYHLRREAGQTLTGRRPPAVLRRGCPRGVSCAHAGDGRGSFDGRIDGMVSSNRDNRVSTCRLALAEWSTR